MLRYLGAKFWLRVLCLGAVGVGFLLMPKQQNGIARAPAIEDTIQLEEAAPVSYSPASGLTYQLEAQLQTYLDLLSTTPAAHDWKFLHQEWFALTRQWFERIFKDPALYERYVQLWLDKRRDSHEWRVSCRREFFPDMGDRELFDKIDWLREQDEWGEMQAKINQGITRIDQSYSAAILELLGENHKSFVKLHDIFMEEHLPSGPASQFFL